MFKRIKNYYEHISLLTWLRITETQNKQSKYQHNQEWVCFLLIIFLSTIVTTPPLEGVDLLRGILSFFIFTAGFGSPG